MDSKSKTLSEILPTGGGSLCDCEGGLPENGGGLAKNGGGLAQGKRKYAEWIKKEVGGGADLTDEVGGSSGDESESVTDEEDGEYVTEDRINNPNGIDFDTQIAEQYEPDGVKAVKVAKEWAERFNM